MKPETRKEAYLAAIGGQDVDVPAKPITREEAYLAAILNNGLGAKNLEDLADVQIVDPVNGYVVKFDAELGKWVAGPASGSGGTSDYTDLANKPQINGNTLAGDKSAEDLGLAGADDIPTKVSDLDNDEDFISDADYVHTDNNYDDTAKGIVGGVTEALAGKQDKLIFDNIPTENSNNPVKSGGVYAVDEAIRQWTTAEAKSVSGNPITLLDGSARNAEGLVVTFEPKQSGSGTPSPTNVRPITGLTECVVDRDSKNLVDISSISDGKALSTDDGSIQTGSEVSYVTDYIPVSKNQTIYIPATGTTRRWFYDTNKTAKVYLNNSGAQAYTPTEDGFIRVTANTTTVSKNALQIEYGNTATPYVPYSHANVTLTFGETVYGAIVNPKTGKVTVTHGIVDLGSLTWTDYQTNCKTTTELANIAVKPSSGSVKANILAEKYENEIPYNVINNQTTKSQICINISGTLIVSDGGTGASPSGNMTYELATPIELTLTPAELELLKGYNYISTNGTTISLNYLPDSLLAEAENYVDAKIPPAPTTDGTYVLTCTVTDGTPAYSWESAT